MIIELDCTTDIAATTEAVWEVLSDYRLDTEWRDAVSVMEPSPAGPSSVGTTTHEVINVSGRTYTNDGVVEEVVPGRRIAWRTTNGADASGSREVVPTPAGGSRVSLRMQVRPHGAEVLIAPMVRRTLRKQLWQDLQNLSRLVEERVVVVRPDQSSSASLGASDSQRRSA